MSCISNTELNAEVYATEPWNIFREFLNYIFLNNRYVGVTGSEYVHGIVVIFILYFILPNQDIQLRTDVFDEYWVLIMEAISIVIMFSWTEIAHSRVIIVVVAAFAFSACFARYVFTDGQIPVFFNIPAVLSYILGIVVMIALNMLILHSYFETKKCKKYYPVIDVRYPAYLRKI